MTTTTHTHKKQNNTSEFDRLHPLFAQINTFCWVVQMSQLLSCYQYGIVMIWEFSQMCCACTILSIVIFHCLLQKIYFPHQYFTATINKCENKLRNAFYIRGICYGTTSTSLFVLFLFCWIVPPHSLSACGKNGFLLSINFPRIAAIQLCS